ncbi:MAG TPA: rhomboid family intramembrane serine protease, partial [Kofleriaceae bacterium]|nr:rhomboid family intramembrane serine protease [Kofleriaceae bacterium]
MRPPPPLSRIPTLPVISAICGLAIFVTVAIKTGRTEIDPFTMSSLAFEGEPWRLAASALPHGDALHLIFNIYWLWFLGTRLEEELGHVTTFLIIVVLAVGSAAAQYAFSAGGIGLSGVGYGIVGCLAVLRRKDARFRDAIDKRTLILFGAWFAFCVITTLAGVWHVGNWAHGAGFVLGLPIALAIAPGSLARRIGGALLTAALVAGFIVAAAFFRPQVNFFGEGGADEERLALEDLEAKRYDSAARRLEQGLDVSPNDSHIWFNYGVALQDSKGTRGMTPLDAWRHAYALDPKNDGAKGAVSRELYNQALDASADGAPDVAERLYRESIALKESGPALWNLAVLLDKKGQHDEAEKLFARAKAIDSGLARRHASDELQP